MSLSEQDKAALEDEIAKFKSEDEDTKTIYVPLLLDDMVAHGHYDGYCQQSEISATATINSVHDVVLLPHSTLAVVAFLALAGCITEHSFRVLLGR